MSDNRLLGSRIMILVANGFNENELSDWQRALLKTGATLKVVGPEQGLVNGWQGQSWGHYFPLDQHIGESLAADYDGVIVPGGERGVAKLASNPHTKRLLRHFRDAHKPMWLFSDAKRFVDELELQQNPQLTYLETTTASDDLATFITAFEAGSADSAVEEISQAA